MTPEEWISEFAEAVGVDPPDAETMSDLLALASVAAHASERRAAPIACYLAGLSSRPIAELKGLADDVAASD